MSERNDPRPISPHLWSWRWHATMASSIFQRISGVTNAAGLIFLSAWLLALSDGRESYEAFVGWAGSWYVQATLFAAAIGLTFHTINGIRYLFWDAGYGFNPSFAEAMSLLNIVIAVVGGGSLWWLFH